MPSVHREPVRTILIQRAYSYCNRFLNHVKGFFDATAPKKTTVAENGFTFVTPSLRTLFDAPTDVTPSTLDSHGVGTRFALYGLPIETVAG